MKGFWRKLVSVHIVGQRLTSMADRLRQDLHGGLTWGTSHWDTIDPLWPSDAAYIVLPKTLHILHRMRNPVSFTLNDGEGWGRLSFANPSPAFTSWSGNVSDRKEPARVLLGPWTDLRNPNSSACGQLRILNERCRAAKSTVSIRPRVRHNSSQPRLREAPNRGKCLRWLVSSIEQHSDGSFRDGTNDRSYKN